jgi:hypothetical protein
MSEECDDSNLCDEINSLANAYAVLVEVDDKLLRPEEGRKLRKAKKRLIDLIVDYVSLLPFSEDTKEEED